MIQTSKNIPSSNRNGNNNFPRFNPTQRNTFSSPLGNRPSYQFSKNTTSNTFTSNHNAHRRSKTNPKFLQNGRKADTLLSMERERNRSLLNGNYQNRQRQGRREDDDEMKDDNENHHNNNHYSNTDNERQSRKTEELALERKEMLTSLDRTWSNNWKIRIKDYEQLYKIPMLKYVYDIMGLVRLESYYDKDRETIESESVDILIDLLPCAGGLFTNLLRHKLASSSPQQSHWLSTQNKHGYKKVHIPDEIKEVLRYARAKFAKDCPQLPLPSQVPFMFNGIWETDMKIACAFNAYLFNKKDHATLPSCDYHLRVWSKGLIKASDNDEDEKKDPNFVPEHINNHPYKPEYNPEDEDTESESDDPDSDVDYDNNVSSFESKKNVTDKEFYTQIKDDLKDVDIEEIIAMNKEALDIKTIKRKNLIQDRDDDEKKEKPKMKKEEPKIIEFGRDDYEVPEYDADYETIQDLVDRLFETVAQPSKGHAIMVLADIRYDPEITIYVWRKPIIQYEEKNTDQIRDKNVENLEIGDKHIEYRKERYFDVNYKGRKVNVGQYIGLSTCIVNEYIHQFFSLFNTEIRFEPKQALELWPDYHYTQTLFEDKAPFEKETDPEIRKKYRYWLGKKNMNKLGNKRTKFTFDDIKEMEDNYECEAYVGEDSDDDEPSDDDDDKPDLMDLKEFKYHFLKAKAVWTVRQKYRDRFIERDLTPRQFRRVQYHATAKTPDDIPNDDDDKDSFDNISNAKSRTIRTNVSSSVDGDNDTVNID